MKVFKEIIAYFSHMNNKKKNFSVVYCIIEYCFDRISY